MDAGHFLRTDPCPAAQELTQAQQPVKGTSVVLSMANNWHLNLNSILSKAKAQCKEIAQRSKDKAMTLCQTKAMTLFQTHLEKCPVLGYSQRAYKNPTLANKN